MKRGFYFSVPELWDICLDKLYDKSRYLNGLEALFQKHGINKSSKILDAACGTGFPAINLHERGYEVRASDRNRDMLEQFERNAKSRDISLESSCLEPKCADWGTLHWSYYADSLDLVLCRGNSLVYVNSWGWSWIARGWSGPNSMLEALKDFHTILKPGGMLYVDVTSAKESPHKMSWELNTKMGPAEVRWVISHPEEKVRNWYLEVELKKGGPLERISFYSYFPPPGEIASLLKTAGFSRIESGAHVDGEGTYDVHLAWK